MAVDKDPDVNDRSDGEGDDSGSEVDPVESEVRLQANMRRIIVAEAYFQKAMRMLHAAKIKQIEERRTAVTTGLSEELAKKNAAANEEFERDMKTAEELYIAKIEALKRKTNGMKSYVNRSQEDNRTLHKSRLISQFSTEIERLRDCLQATEEFACRLIEATKQEDEEVKEEQEDDVDDQIDEEMLLRRKRPRSDIIAFVEQLQPHEIDEDLALCEYAMATAAGELR